MTLNIAIRHYNDAKYSGYMTSPEILSAIHEIGTGDLADGDSDGSDVYRIWSSPTVGEAAEIWRRAWATADEDEVTLRWGCETLRRDPA